MLYVHMDILPYQGAEIPQGISGVPIKKIYILLQL